MKAYKLSKYGASNLKQITMDEPQLKSGEVLVKQYATSINSADADMLKGTIFGRFSGLLYPKYKVLGSDLAGIVVKASSDVNNVKVGDRVFGDMSEEGFATYASHKAVKASALTKMPEGMSFIMAASLASAGVIALQAIEKKELDNKSNVCINGVGGGMGTISLQIAKHYGANVLGVDSEYKKDAILKLGADEYIDYEKEEYISLKNKYDLIIDCQCYKPIKNFLPMLKDEGIYTMIGGSLRRIIQTTLSGKRLTKGTNKSIGVLLGEMNNLKRMKKLGDLWSDNSIKAVIDTVYNFNELPKAFEHFLSGKFTGKIVIKIDDEEQNIDYKEVNI